MSMRILRLIIVGLVFAVGVFPLSAEAVSLKHNSVIKDSTIKLGDIFSGLDRQADRVLGPAPLPGNDMVLNARTLMRIAIALDLPWRPAHNAEQVTLRRSATVIRQDVIEDELRRSLRDHGLNGNYDLAMRSVGEDIILPESENASIEIENFSYSADRNSFEAKIVAPSRSNPLYTANVSGTVHRLIEIPVLREPLRAGTIIGARDLQMISVKEHALKSNMILDADTLIGMTPRTLVQSNSPIKVNDVEPPQVVARGELITMIFQSGPLVLTAQGKALENGAVGDMIRVVNSGSSKTLQAVVTNTNEVTIQSH